MNLPSDSLSARSLLHLAQGCFLLVGVQCAFDTGIVTLVPASWDAWSS